MKLKSNELQIVYNAVYDSEKDAEKLLAVNSPAPNQQGWKLFLERIFLAAGGIQLLAGIIFFFAYNWKDIHRFGKLGIAATLFTVAGGVAILFRNKSNLHKASLASMAVLVGVLMALWGQIYQTGADSYLLFLIWAILIIPITVISKSVYNWGLWTILLNIALIYHAGQVMREWFNPISGLFLILVNGGVLTVYEYLIKRSPSIKRVTWFSSLISLFLFVWLSIAAGAAVFMEKNSILILMNIVTVGSVFYFYYQKRESLGQLALCMLSGISMTFMFIVKYGHFVDGGYFLFSGFILVGLIAAAVKALQSIQSSWE